MKGTFSEPSRRRFVKGAAALASAFAVPQLAASDLFAPRQDKIPPATGKGDGFRSLFDGVSLNGWTRKPRDLQRPSLGNWSVQDGIIVGGQEKPGFGCYLVSDETFSDFELEIEARPDWMVDTGIYVRTTAQGNVGFQTLLDHRPHGGVGGYFGNWVGNFHAVSYCFTGEVGPDGRLLRLVPEKPSEPVDKTNLVPLDYAVPVEEFLRNWNLNGWNRFRIRSVGALPHLTTWINGLKVAELDTARMKMYSWDPDKVLATVGRAGHISLEVHDNLPSDPLASQRWAPGAVCRWRNIYIKTL